MSDPRLGGPCKMCGATDYLLSMGGPSICPTCDMGATSPYVLQKHIANLTEENRALKERCERYEKLMKELEPKLGTLVSLTTVANIDANDARGYLREKLSSLELHDE